MLPELNAQMQSRESQVSAFLGIHYGEGPSMGQAEETQNLSTARFPALCTREGRAQEGTWTNATGIYYRGGLLTVAGSKLYFDGTEIGDITPGEKQFATVNSKIVIFPDKVMVDSVDKTITRLEASAEIAAGLAEVVAGAEGSSTGKTIKVHMGNYQAAVVGSGNLGGNDPDHLSRWAEYATPFNSITSVSVNQETGAVTIQKDSTNKRVYDIEVGDLVYSTALGMDGVTKWGKITKRYYHYEPLPPVGPSPKTAALASSTEYYNIGWDYDIYGVVGSSTPFAGMEDLGFKAGDTVEITGCTTHPENNKTITIRELGTVVEGGETLYTMTFDPDTLTAGEEAGAVSIRRKVPALSLICESGNRLWGVEGNTIFGSALGDPTNFYTYDGLDTDSFAVAVASDGAFTAVVPYGSSVLFFKEEVLHKLLGDYPSNYQLYDSKIPGVKRESSGSVCRINEVVYYHGREGVYQYAGGTPKLISQDFGPRRYEKASAGALGDRYYISMKDLRTAAWGMWVYDIQNRLWVREDGTHAAGFASGGGKLWYLDGDGTKVMCATPDTSTEVVAWSVTLDRFDERLRSRNAFVRLVLRAEVVESTGWLQVEVSTDKGPWRLIYPRKEHWTGVCVIPIIFPWCDGLRIRISGQGKVMLHSITRETGQ